MNIYLLEQLQNRSLSVADFVLPVGAMLVLSAVVAAICACFCAHRWGNKLNVNFMKKEMIAFACLEVLVVGLTASVHGMCGYTVRIAMYTLMLLCMSYQDIKTRESEHYFHVIALVSGLVGMDGDYKDFLYRLVGCAIIGAILCIVVVLTKGVGFGGGDLKCILVAPIAIGLVKGLIGTAIGLIIGSIVNVIIAKCKSTAIKKHSYPQLPYLAIGLLAMAIL